MTATAARGLMRRARSAALATSLRDEDGRPYVSLVSVACDCSSTLPTKILGWSVRRATSAPPQGAASPAPDRLA